MKGHGDHVFFIAVKRPNQKRARLLTSHGGLTRLRLHAAQFSSESVAREACAKLAVDNPGVSFVPKRGTRGGA